MNSQQPKKLYRSRSNRMVAGVIGGLAEFLGIDATLLRVIFIILALTSMGFAIIVYLVLIPVIPEEPTQPKTEK